MSAEIISLIVAIVSLIGTLLVALFNIRSAQMQVSDKIAAGSSQLLDEMQEARNRDKEQIQQLQMRVRHLEEWQERFTYFLVEIWEGSKKNENFIIGMNLEPPYQVPDLPLSSNN